MNLISISGHCPDGQYQVTYKKIWCIIGLGKIHMFFVFFGGGDTFLCSLYWSKICSEL